MRIKHIKESKIKEVKFDRIDLFNFILQVSTNRDIYFTIYNTEIEPLSLLYKKFLSIEEGSSMPCMMENIKRRSYVLEIPAAECNYIANKLKKEFYAEVLGCTVFNSNINIGQGMVQYKILIGKEDEELDYITMMRLTQLLPSDTAEIEEVELSFKSEEIIEITNSILNKLSNEDYEYNGHEIFHDGGSIKFILEDNNLKISYNDELLMILNYDETISFVSNTNSYYERIKENS